MYRNTESHFLDENIIVGCVLSEHIHLEPIETDSSGDSNHSYIFS